MKRFFSSTPAIFLTVLILAVLASLPVSFGIERTTLNGAAILVVAALICFIAIPLAIIKYLYKRMGREFGFQLPVRKKEALLLSIAVLIPHLLFLPYFASQAEFQTYYSLVGQPAIAIFLFLGPLSLLYYLAEEFLFRGYFLFALFDKWKYWALAPNAILFGLLHAGKPPLEMLYATASALALSWLAIKTQSFLPAAILHWLIALTLTLIIFVFHPVAMGGELHF